MWNVYADVLTSLPDKSKFCPVRFDTDVELTVARTWIVLYNNPTFTQLTLGIYTDVAGQPGDLLFESTNVQTKPAITTANSAARDVWFEFKQRPWLKAHDRYNFVLGGTGYAFNKDSHLAWKKSYPDAIYPHGLNDGRKLSSYPYDLAFLGKEL